MNKLPNLIVLMILTLITLLIWLTLNIYRNFTKETPPAVPIEIVLPVSPYLDTETIDQMEKRIYPI